MLTGLCNLTLLNLSTAFGSTGICNSNIGISFHSFTFFLFSVLYFASLNFDTFDALTNFVSFCFTFCLSKVSFLSAAPLNYAFIGNSPSDPMARLKPSAWVCIELKRQQHFISIIIFPLAAGIIHFYQPINCQNMV